MIEPASIQETWLSLLRGKNFDGDACLEGLVKQTADRLDALEIELKNLPKITAERDQLSLQCKRFHENRDAWKAERDALKARIAELVGECRQLNHHEIGNTQQEAVWEAETAEARRQSSEVVQIREERDAANKRIAALEAESGQLRARLACMCGDDMDKHSLSEPHHTAVSMYDHTLDQVQAERDVLKARIAELEKALAHLRDNRNDLIDRVAELAKENVQLKADIADLERHE